MGYDFRISCVGVWSFRPCSLSVSPKFLQCLHVWKRGCGRVLVCEWREELGQLSAIDPTPVHKVFCVSVGNNKEKRKEMPGTGEKSEQDRVVCVCKIKC